MIDDLELILTGLLLALSAGGLVDRGRACHGRAAGFRIDSLVCLASGVLMLAALFQWRIVPGSFMETVRIDRRTDVEHGGESAHGYSSD